MTDPTRPLCLALLAACAGEPAADDLPDACATGQPIAAPTGADMLAVRIDVPVSTALHPVDHGVAGVAWNDGALTALAPLQPPWVRADARLGGISPSAESDLQFDALLGRVSEIRAAGGEPVLILAYAPDWMGEARAQGCEVQFVGGACAPSRVRPDDLDVWEDFIFEVVHTVATAPDAATHFEVWNEPDVAAVFWHDTPEAFLELAIRTHRAVQRVEEETGIDPTRASCPTTCTTPSPAPIRRRAQPSTAS